MKFGKVENPELIDFTLPEDHPDTKRVLGQHKNKGDLEAFIGCAKWNRTDLKGFYPRGTKDELTYYSRQFNSIELNATFYKMPDWQQIETWKNKTPENFKFFPKITDLITHYRRLINVEEPIQNFCNAVSNFDEKLGMAFMQLHDNFSPKDFDRLKSVLEMFPKEIPLAVEVRNKEWFSNEQISNDYFSLLENLSTANIIVDTAGRRDMLHMRLTSPVAFVRYVGSNHSSDTERLDDWVKRIRKWKENGLKKLYFFIHQNLEVESPLLAAHFIQKLNDELNISLKIPNKPGGENLTLFN